MTLKLSELHKAIHVADQNDSEDKLEVILHDDATGTFYDVGEIYVSANTGKVYLTFNGQEPRE